MAIEYLKKAEKTSATGEDDTRRIVAEMLAEIESGGEEAARAYGKKLDGYDGEIVVSRETIEAAAAKVPQQLKDDLQFAHDRIRGFAEKQKASIGELLGRVRNLVEDAPKRQQARRGRAAAD